MPKHPSICIALHDVAAATWTRCQRLIAAVEAVAPDAPLTLLVVPRWHAPGDAADRFTAQEEPAFVDRLRARAARGDELALHGWRHVDDAQPVQATLDPRSWSAALSDHAARRIYTASEGEFFRLDETESQRRLALGLAWAQSHRLAMTGFVAPAWMLSAQTWKVLRASPLVYTTTWRRLHRLDDRCAIDAPCITASARSAWRRLASRVWLRAAERAFESTPLVRLGLHPADAHDAALVRAWQRLIERMLATREPLTKIDALRRYAPKVAPVATTPAATPEPITRPARTSLG